MKRNAHSSIIDLPHLFQATEPECEQPAPASHITIRNTVLQKRSRYFLNHHKIR